MRTRTTQPIPLALTTLIAIFSALVALALTGGHDAAAHSGAEAVHGKADIPRSELALRQNMRKLWEDHITWTRLAIISLTTDAPDAKATVARLLENQADIGDAIKPYYGPAAGNRLTSLLREHIAIAAELIAAAGKGDADGVAVNQTRWTENADRIASFLSKANPHAWKLPATTAMMHDHLRLTTSEVLARLNGDWKADVRAYDRIHIQILRMADMLSSGLVAQFPSRFR
jgi:hypothetical protein